MVHFNLKPWVKKLFAIVSSVFLPLSSAFASSTSNLPFTSPMSMLAQAITGSALTSISVIMIAATCLMLAFHEWGEGFKKIINIVLWLSIAFGATSFIMTMFGGGAVF